MVRENVFLLVFSLVLFGYHEIAYPLLAIKGKEEKGEEREKTRMPEIRRTSVINEFQNSQTIILKMTDES